MSVNHHITYLSIEHYLCHLGCRARKSESLPPDSTHLTVFPLYSTFLHASTLGNIRDRYQFLRETYDRTYVFADAYQSLGAYSEHADS